MSCLASMLHGCLENGSFFLKTQTIFLTLRILPSQYKHSPPQICQRNTKDMMAVFLQAIPNEAGHRAMLPAEWSNSSV